MNENPENEKEQQESVKEEVKPVEPVAEEPKEEPKQVKSEPEPVKAEPVKEEKKKPKKSFGRRFLNFIIGMIIYLVIVAVVSFAVFTYLENQKDDEEDDTKTSASEESDEEESKSSSSKKSSDDKDSSPSTDWESAYVEVLEDEDNFSSIDSLKVSLCDIDQDETPELVIFGEKSNGDTQIIIYHIGSNNKYDTIKVSISSECTLEFLVDSKDNYEWYIVTEDEVLYEIDLEDYEIEKSSDDYDDYDSVSTAKKTSYDGDTSKAETILKSAKNKYVSTEELIEGNS